MKRLEKKHLLAIRWLHWINFPLLFVMIWSGMLIGIKSLKRIGTISFTNECPHDFWAERGYDWYSGH